MSPPPTGLGRPPRTRSPPLRSRTPLRGRPARKAASPPRRTPVPAQPIPSTLGNDYRLVLASGYGDPTQPDQGRTLVNTSALTGLINDKDVIAPPVSCTTGQELAVLTDVAAAKTYHKSEQGQLLASYFGDTFGNLWRFVPQLSGGLFTNSGDVTLVDEAGCSHPLHFSPTVVQLDRDNSANHAGEIYLVQVTNSVLDTATRSFLAPSQMIFRRDQASGGVVTPDLTFGGGTGREVLSAGNPAQICAVTNGSGGCTTQMPPGARPASTPVAILKADGSGFQVYTIWYVPPANACGKGTSYITVHEVSAINDSITQKTGQLIGNEPVSGTVFVGGKLFYTSELGGAVDITTVVGQTFSLGGSGAGTATPERFKRMGWLELP